MLYSDRFDSFFPQSYCISKEKFIWDCRQWECRVCASLKGPGRPSLLPACHCRSQIWAGACGWKSDNQGHFNMENIARGYCKHLFFFLDFLVIIVTTMIIIDRVLCC